MSKFESAVELLEDHLAALEDLIEKEQKRLHAMDAKRSSLVQKLNGINDRLNAATALAEMAELSAYPATKDAVAEVSSASTMAVKYAREMLGGESVSISEMNAAVRSAEDAVSKAEERIERCRMRRSDDDRTRREV